MSGHEIVYETLTVTADSVRLGDLVHVHGAERPVRNMRSIAGGHKILLFDSAMPYRLSVRAAINARRPYAPSPT
ncbi:hypothetical protein LHJ74_27650 [Streptomyces sp. N2-109]|uniref:Uncharacterized protein n=1 Tax=Streptomyces gossypii TaxID=2883101 RepID=A0ABT2K280_9ACTN|nr:hypothetical protein [Streptomyces gossypii]MCT2593635.1 hypothetical protein [Streptomyces gossypii]